MSEPPRPQGLPTTLSSHEELVERLPAILGHLNRTPELARLLLVNPLLVFEDLGIAVADDLADHIQKTLGFPPARVEQIAKARRNLRALLAEALPARTPGLPKTPKARAEILFDQLALPYSGQRPEALTIEELRPLRELHPIARAMYEVGRLERGALQYLSRGEYNRHKAGAPHHSWISGMRFQKGT